MELKGAEHGNSCSFGEIIGVINLKRVSICKSLQFRSLYKDTEVEEVPDVQQLLVISPCMYIDSFLAFVNVS